MVTYALFRLECNIRNGTILGVVGAGGLGSEIALSIDYFEYDKLATTLLAVLAFVLILEAVSQRLRQRGARWALAFAGIGATLALWRLDIPWTDLWSAPGLALFSFEDMRPDLPDHVRGGPDGRHLDDGLGGHGALGPRRLCAGPPDRGALDDGQLPPRPRAPLTAGPGPRAGHQMGQPWPTAGHAGHAELTLALVFVVWVGGGPTAGILAIAVRTTWG